MSACFGCLNFAETSDMEISTKNLLHQLASIAAQTQADTQRLISLSPSCLVKGPGRNAWNALQCAEHLNRYCVFYLPQLREALRYTGNSTAFKSSIIGNMLVKTVDPIVKKRKMKTFRAMNPSVMEADEAALSRFKSYQQELLDLLKDFEETDLNCKCIAVTFTKLIKLTTGDTLRFMVYHNRRHITQALKAAGL